MKDWISKLLAKYLGGSFVSRAFTSLVALIIGYLAGFGQYLPPEASAEFAKLLADLSANLTSLLGLAGVYFVPLLIDAIFTGRDNSKKPEQPKVVK